MRQFVNLRLFQIALMVSLGMIIGHYWPCPKFWNPWAGTGLVLGLSLLRCVSSFQFWNHPRIWRLGLWSLLILIGLLRFQQQMPPINHWLKEHETHEVSAHPIVVQYSLNSWGNLSRYEAKYYCTQHRDAINVVLTTSDSVLSKSIEPGQKLWVMRPPELIKGPSNPGGFDPKHYYLGQGMNAKIHLNSTDIMCTELGAKSLKAWAQNLNNYLGKTWQKAPISNEAQAMAMALILGQTRELSRDLKRRFANAGALHILALSGLHVGLVVMVLNWLLRPLKYNPMGLIISSVIIIAILWFYALICGLSPSITRAVSLFSVLQLGQLLKRPLSLSNGLLLTFVLLIWLKPYWLFSVGFQLSFSAVMALSLLPLVQSKIRKPQTWGLKYLYDLTLVSLIAQIGVGPLSIFYFHQFPLLFWLSNLMIIPFLGPLVISGICLTLIGLTEIPVDLFYRLWEGVMNSMVMSVNWIAGHEHLLLQNLSLSLYWLGIYYGCFTLFWFAIQGPMIKTKRHLFWHLPLILSMAIIGALINRNGLDQKEVQWSLLHVTGHSHLILNTPQGMVLWHDYMTDSTLDLRPEKNRSTSFQRRLIQDWEHHHQKPITHQQPEDSFVIFDDQPVIIISGSNHYPKIKKGIVLLTHNANIHLEELIHSLEPQLILADASNYKIQVERWRENAKILGVKFLDTYAQGAIESSEAEFKKYF